MTPPALRAVTARPLAAVPGFAAEAGPRPAGSAPRGDEIGRDKIGRDKIGRDERGKVRMLVARPAWRGEARETRRDRLRRMLAGSALLHLVLLALVLLTVSSPPKFGNPSEAPPIDMVFQAPQQPKAERPQPGAAQPHTEQTETPDRSLPTPQTTPNPAVVPPSPAPPTPAPPLAQLPPPPAPPPTTQPEDVAPPEVSLDLPDENDDQLQAAPQALPLPLPPPPRPTRRVARAAPRHEAPGSSLSSPMEFSFSGAPPPPGRGGRRHQQGIDMAMAPKLTGGSLQEAVAHLSAPGATADWEAEIREWVEEHKYYPAIAGENGEEGASTVRVTVSADGTVRNVQLVDSAGSRWLDSAWQSVFRGNKVPPLPEDMGSKDYTFEFTMNFILIRR